MNIKPIETVYNGYKFRSRLEARWAVFFDAAGIPYQYEPEGYEIDGIKYLPDFYLPSFDAHVEVKPDRPGIENDILKCMKMIQWGGPIKTIIFLGDIPSMDWVTGGHLHFPALYYKTGSGEPSGGGVVSGWWFFQDVSNCDGCKEKNNCHSETCDRTEVYGHISSYVYMCPFCCDCNNVLYGRWSINKHLPLSLAPVSDYALRRDTYFLQQIYGKNDDDRKFAAEMTYNANQKFYTALEKAKQARFEHGECG